MLFCDNIFTTVNDGFNMIRYIINIWKIKFQKYHFKPEIILLITLQKCGKVRIPKIDYKYFLNVS